MQVTITFRGMDATESLKFHVRERVEHIEKYFDRSVEVHAVLSVERYLQHADITIQAGPYVLRGKSKSEDLYKSIDEAVEKIERQVKRYKDRIRTIQHHPRDEVAPTVARHAVMQVAGPEVVDEPEEWAQGPRVIKTNEFAVNVMTLDDAVMQMDLMNNEFLVFNNVGTGETNVVYRRKDGHFGLIEAPAGRPGSEGEAKVEKRLN